MADRGLRLLGLALLLAGCRPSAAAPSLQFPATVQRTAGGLTIATELDRSTPAVAIVSTISAGMAQDPPGQEGLAHLVEHLAHRRREADGSNWRTRMTATGADWQGMTFAAQTVYFVMVPAFAAADTLAGEAARLADPLAGIDEASFDRERRVVIDELRLRSHRHGSWGLLDCISASLYPGHPELAATDATEESLQELTLGDAQRFADRYYRPSRTTVLLAGDLPAEAAATFDRAYRDSAGALPAPPPRPEKPARFTPAQDCQSAPATEPEVWVAWRVPPANGPKGGVLLLAAAWMDAQLSGLLDMRHRELRSVEIVAQPGRGGGVLAIRAVVASNASGYEVARLLMHQVDDLWGHRPGHIAPGRLRPRLATAEALNLEDLGRRSFMTGLWMGLTGAGPGDYRRLKQQALEVSDDDLDQFIDTYLQPKQARVWLPNTAGDPPPFTARMIESLIPGRDEAAPAAAVAPASWSNVPQRADAAPAAGWPRFLYRTEQRRLDNGLTVLAVRRPDSIAASAVVAFRGGHAFGLPGVALAAELANRPAWRTTGLGGSFDVDASASLASVHAQGADLGRALGWLSDEVSINSDTMFSHGPQWPPEDLAIRLVPELASGERDTEARLDRAFLSAVFDGHRYGQPPLSQQLDKVSEQQVSDWLAGLRQPGNAMLVVVSSEEPARTLDRAADAFGSWRADGPPVAPPPPLPALRAVGQPERAPVIVSDAASAHARVTLGCRLPTSSPREAARAHLLAQLLDADFWNEVREPHGHSYGFSAYETAERGTSVVALDAEIPVAVLTEVLAKLRQRWRQWAQQGFDAHQVRVVRSGAAAGTLLEGNTSVALARVLARWWALGRSLEERDRWAATLAALEPTEMQATAALCRANLVLAIAADRGLANAAVKAAWKD